jgi:hypothetical protein
MCMPHLRMCVPLMLLPTGLVMILPVYRYSAALRCSWFAERINAYLVRRCLPLAAWHRLRVACPIGAMCMLHRRVMLCASYVCYEFVVWFQLLLLNARFVWMVRPAYRCSMIGSLPSACCMVIGHVHAWSACGSSGSTPNDGALALLVHSAVNAPPPRFVAVGCVKTHRFSMMRVHFSFPLAAADGACACLIGACAVERLLCVAQALFGTISAVLLLSRASFADCVRAYRFSMMRRCLPLAAWHRCMCGPSVYCASLYAHSLVMFAWLTLLSRASLRLVASGIIASPIERRCGFACTWHECVMPAPSARGNTCLYAVTYSSVCLRFG